VNCFSFFFVLSCLIADDGNARVLDETYLYLCAYTLSFVSEVIIIKRETKKKPENVSIEVSKNFIYLFIQGIN